MWGLDTYAVWIKPKKERSGFPPCGYVIYQTSLCPYVDTELQVFTRGMVNNGNYVCMDNLSALDGYWQGSELAHMIISREVCTPQRWASELSDHPDRMFSNLY